MNLWNVIRLGIGSVACTSLLVACADGRGTNGFKSYQFTAEERAQNKAKLDALKPAPPAPTDTTPTPDDTVKPGEDVATTPGQDAPAPATPATPATPETPAPGNNQGDLFTQMDDTAKGKLFAEQRLPTEAEQQVAAKVQDLNLTIDEELKDEKRVNQAAASLIKGITVIPTGTDEQRLISIQAIVNIGGEDLNFDASEIPVKFPKEGESVPNILFSLNKPCDQGPVAAKNSLWAAAKCRDEKCWQIEVVLSFEVAGGQRANGVVVIEPGKNQQGQSEWQIKRSNIGTPKTFVEAQAAGKACENPAKPATDPAKPDATPAAPAKPAPATVSEADKKRCQALEAEGFSCLDTPGEIARMRNARAAAKNKEAKSEADKKRCQALEAEGFSCLDTPGEIARMRNARAAAKDKAAPAATVRGQEQRFRPMPKAEEKPATVVRGQEQRFRPMPETEEAKRCASLKAEGLSCQMTNDEIARRRNARAAAAKVKAEANAKISAERAKSNTLPYGGPR